MTRQEFLEVAWAAGIDPWAFDLNGPQNETYVLDNSNYDYRVYYSEEGSSFKFGASSRSPEALEYLLKLLKRPFDQIAPARRLPCGMRCS